MQRNQALAILAAHQDELRDLGILSLSIFGSVARDEAGPDSDVDVLVEIERPMGWFRFFDIQQRLEALLGRPVDLVTYDGLRADMREHILSEAIRAA